MMPVLLALAALAASQTADSVHYRLYKFERAIGDDANIRARDLGDGASGGGDQRGPGGHGLGR